MIIKKVDMLDKIMNKWYPTERLIEHSEKQVEIKLQKRWEGKMKTLKKQVIEIYKTKITTFKIYKAYYQATLKSSHPLAKREIIWLRETFPEWNMEYQIDKGIKL